MLGAMAMTSSPIKYLITGLGCHTPPAQLLHLDPHLFPGGPQPGEVIEVSGGSNCGKSSLAVHLVAAALLPKAWRGIRIRGCGAGVLFLDCDLHFSIIHLDNMMQKRIKYSLRQGKEALKKKKLGQQYDKSLIDNAEELRKLLHSDKESLKAEIASLVKQCLKSFYYLRCTNSPQYSITMLAMEEYLVEQSNISLVVIDSLSAFSWYDRIYRARNWFKLREYYNDLFAMVIASIKKYSAVLVATRHTLFAKNFTEEKYKDRYKNQLGESKDEDEHKEPDESFQEVGGSDRDYLGSVWTNSVTHKITLSVVNTDISSEYGSVSVNSISKDSVNTSVTDSVPNKNASKSADNLSLPSESTRQLYFAEVSANQKKTKLIYSIHEDGLKWENQ